MKHSGKECMQRSCKKDIGYLVEVEIFGVMYIHDNSQIRHIYYQCILSFSLLCQS